MLNQEIFRKYDIRGKTASLAVHELRMRVYRIPKEVKL